MHHLRLFMPVSHKRKEICIVRTQFLWVKRRDTTLSREDGRENLLDDLLIEVDGFGTSDGHTLSTGIATNGTCMGSCHVEDGIHFEKLLKLNEVRSGH